MVKEFSNDIRVDFGLDKYTKAAFIRGKLRHNASIKLDNINELDPPESYKYLVINKGDGIQYVTMKEKKQERSITGDYDLYQN